MRDKYVHLVLFLALLFAIWIPRAFALDHFVTADERRWVERSGKFLIALANQDFATTYQKEHPGVITMWAGAVGYLVALPGEKQAEFLAGGLTPAEHFAEDSIEPIRILKTSRQVLLILIAAALLIAYLVLDKLVGRLPAALATLFVALDPFYIAHTRVLHLDGILTTLVFLSLVLFLAYLHFDRRKLYLIASGIAAGLAFLAKSPALFLAPFIALLMLLELLFRVRVERQSLTLKALLSVGLALAVWGGLAALTFLVFFPAMWVDPLGVLEKIFIQAYIYADEGHSSALFFNGQIFADGIIGPEYWYFYPLTWLWRTTPVVLLGIVFGLIMVFSRQKGPREIMQGRVILQAGLFILLFLVFINLGTKKFDRYALPIYPWISLIAAIGWAAALQWIRARLPIKSRALALSGVVFTIGALQFIPFANTFPYYLSYYNSLLGGIDRAEDGMIIGWGEGLDQAARYLNAKPGIDKMVVVSWYSRGSFDYFFEGRRAFGFDKQNVPDFLVADYAVVYVHQWQRQVYRQDVLDQLAALEPEYVVEIQGLEYVEIYDLSALKSEE
jgi:hypothetical protein